MYSTCLYIFMIKCVQDLSYTKKSWIFSTCIIHYKNPWFFWSSHLNVFHHENFKTCRIHPYVNVYFFIFFKKIKSWILKYQASWSPSSKTLHSWKISCSCYLDEFLHVRPSCGGIVVLYVGEEYLESINKWCICDVHLFPVPSDVSSLNCQILADIRDTECKITRLNWPRKKGPSSNFERETSILSRAASDDQQCITGQ